MSGEDSGAAPAAPSPRLAELMGELAILEGDEHYHAQQITAIRQHRGRAVEAARADGVSLAQLADAFGCSREYVRKIIAGAPMPAKKESTDA